MSRIESHRIAKEINGKAVLYMQIGDTYLNWFSFFNLEDQGIWRIVFAYIFEQQYAKDTRGTDLAKHITEVKIGDKEKNKEGKSISPIGAKLNISLQAYKKMRLTEKEKGQRLSPLG